MSIIIKGMDMPRACYYCHFLFRDKRHNKVYCTVHHEFDKWLDISDAPAEGRADDCPLIELPPHGRLIDEEDMDLVMFEAKHSAEYEGKFIITEDEIYALPTIIESEGEDA